MKEIIFNIGNAKGGVVLYILLALVSSHSSICVPSSYVHDIFGTL